MATPARGQSLQAAQHESRTPLRVLRVIEPQVRQPAQQRRDRDLSLDARELGAEAEVDAAAKRQRLYVRPGNVEPLRVIGIDRRVVVGRTQQAQHTLALRDFLAAEVVDVFQRDPADELERGIVTQKFLDRVGDQLRSGLEQCELVGIAVQRQQAIADQIDGGLVAGAEQQEDVRGQFRVGQLAAALLGLHQLRGQIVAGFPPPQLKQLLAIPRCHHEAGVALLDLSRRQRHRLELTPALA
jgi:hypothetical protein